MTQFRKKPVVIDAIKVKEALFFAAEEWKSLPQWLSEAYEKGHILFLAKEISVLTLEGTMKADFDDWLIRGVKGEIYPCKPDIFSQTYDEVSL